MNPLDLDLHHALSVLVSAPAGLLDKLGAQKAGLLLLLGAVGSGVTIGSVGTMRLADFGTHEERIVDLETWRADHVRVVSEPGIARIERLEERADSLYREVVMIRSMLYQMYCRDWPSRCEAVPSGGGGREP